jgi:hypothetical protein
MPRESNLAIVATPPIAFPITRATPQPAAVGAAAAIDPAPKMFVIAHSSFSSRAFPANGPEHLAERLFGHTFDNTYVCQIAARS